MNDSPTFSRSPPGLSWLLSGTHKTQNLAPTAEDDNNAHTTSPSQASLLSQSSSNGGGRKQYNSLSHSSSAARMSASPPGMSWLLAGGTHRAAQNLAPTAEDNNHVRTSPSQTSLHSYSHSQSGSNGGRRQYNSMSLSSSLVRIGRSPSPSLVQSSSLIIPPELTIQQQQPMQTQQEPIDILLQSIQACTANIFGLYGLEVWKFDKKFGSLLNIPIMPPHALDVKQHRGGLFIKRIPQEADYNSPNYNPTAREAFDRLTETTRLDYVAQGTTDPGVGVAGALWTESNYKSLPTKTLAAVQSGVQTLSHTISDRLHFNTSPRRTVRGINSTAQENEQVPNSIQWRDIDSLAEDPDQPYDERLQLFARAGFGLAAGISFNIRGFKGIVVFFVNPHADMRKLSSNTNKQMIDSAAQFIGSAAAVQIPLENAKLQRTSRPITNWRTLRVKILAVIKFQRPIFVRQRGRSRSWGNRSPSLRRANSFGMLRRAASVAMINREESFQILSEVTTQLKNDVQKSVVKIQHQSKVRTMKWFKKIQGGHASIPPSFNNTQTVWTFVGVLSTHTILSRLSFFLATKQYRLVLGPLGALTTLQYNLTAAPASQPRNAFFGQLIALCTCYLLHQIPSLDVWHRVTLAPAIVATVTARLGLIHPPAGATSVVFSYENHGIEDMILFLVGNLIAIVTAVAINNMSEKRQYPITQWI